MVYGVISDIQQQFWQYWMCTCHEN